MIKQTTVKQPHRQNLHNRYRNYCSISILIVTVWVKHSYL